MKLAKIKLILNIFVIEKLHHNYHKTKNKFFETKINYLAIRNFNYPCLGKLLSFYC